MNAATEDLGPGDDSAANQSRLDPSPCAREVAALALSPASLQQSCSAMRHLAAQLLLDLDALEKAVPKVANLPQGRRLARAASLMICSRLPIRPETCPFCQEYADSRCPQCGYAKTHGGICNQDSSAFVSFIEAYGRLGLAIKSPHHPELLPGEELASQESSVAALRKEIWESLDRARFLTTEFSSYLEGPPATVYGAELMAAKQRYLMNIVRALPLPATGCQEAEDERMLVIHRLLDYW